jgi:hypothetical protein
MSDSIIWAEFLARLDLLASERGVTKMWTSRATALGADV